MTPRNGFVAAIGMTLLATLLAACQTDSRDQVLKTDISQVQARSIETRTFDTSDKIKTLRTVMATMQDLGFVLDKADATLGEVSGTKMGKTSMGGDYALRMSVTVRPVGEKQMLVRANAQYGLQEVVSPKPYQDFFAALENAMFLTAHNVN